MTSLHELQRAFCGAMLSDDAGGVAALIRGNGIPAAQRLQIYRNNSQSGFLSTLAATFPVIERLAGADWFRQSAIQYQRRFPSRAGDLQFVGDRYSEFLRQRLAGTEYEYFHDVARLEWAYQEVLTAADGTKLNPATLGAVADDDHERIEFRLHPAVRLVESEFPILAIWKSNQPGADARDVSLDAGPSRVLLVRRADFIELRELSAPCAALFELFSRGAHFAAAAAEFQAAHPQAALGESLRELIALQTIAGYRLHPPNENKT